MYTLCEHLADAARTYSPPRSEESIRVGKIRSKGCFLLRTLKRHVLVPAQEPGARDSHNLLINFWCVSTRRRPLSEKYHLGTLLIQVVAERDKRSDVRVRTTKPWQGQSINLKITTT